MHSLVLLHCMCTTDSCYSNPLFSCIWCHWCSGTCVTGNNDIFVAGGSIRKLGHANARQVPIVIHECVSANLWAFSVNDRSWEQRTSMRYARCQFSMVVVDGQVISMLTAVVNFLGTFLCLQCSFLLIYCFLAYGTCCCCIGLRWAASLLLDCILCMLLWDCLLMFVFSGTLQLHCKFPYSHRMLSVVVCLSVTWVYCDKTAEARIMQFSLKCSPVPELFAFQVWLQNSKRAPLIRGSNWDGVVMNFVMLYLVNSAR